MKTRPAHEFFQFNQINCRDNVEKLKATQRVADTQVASPPVGEAERKKDRKIHRFLFFDEKNMPGQNIVSCEDEKKGIKNV